MPPLGADRCVHAVLGSDLLDFASSDAFAGDAKVDGVAESLKRRLGHVVTPLEAVAELAVRVRSEVEPSFAGFVTVIQVFLLGVGTHAGHDSDTVRNARICEERLEPCDETRV